MFEGREQMLRQACPHAKLEHMVNIPDKLPLAQLSLIRTISTKAFHISAVQHCSADGLDDWPKSHLD